jgi:hypothetical protein
MTLLARLSRGRGSPSLPDAATRVKAWARDRFMAGPEDALFVHEVTCDIAGCPPVHTLIALLHPCGRVEFRLQKPLVEITEDDIDRLGRDGGPVLAEACC